MIGWSQIWSKRREPRGENGLFERTGESYEEWKVCFWAKICLRNENFHHKTSILKIRFGFSGYSWLFYTLLRQKLRAISFLLWKMTKVSTCQSKLRDKLRSSIEKYIALKHFNTFKTYLVLKSRYRCLFWAFSLCCSPSNTWVNWGFWSGVFVWLIQK